MEQEQLTPAAEWVAFITNTWLSINYVSAQDAYLYSLLFFTTLLTVFVHVFSMAAAAHIFGIIVKYASVGYGPVMLNVKHLKLKLLPLGGYVRMLDSRVTTLSEDDFSYAFDKKNKWTRALITLSGCLALFLVSAIFLGKESPQYLLFSIGQIITGALHPISKGSTYIAEGINAVRNGTPVMIVSLVAIKLCAFNILPLPSLNGGQALMAIIGLPEKTNQILSMISVFVYFPLLALWFFSLIHYCWT